MKRETKIPSIGEPYEGGFFAGRIRINQIEYALIVAPKAEGDHDPIAWNRSSKNVEAALSYCDGFANTEAMAAAGSALAKWARKLRIGGYDDWYLWSLDEAEVCYRNLKPTLQENSLWMRSGINLSAVPPCHPYTRADPQQTAVEMFRAGGGECFEAAGYWTSTQHAADSGYAWNRYFNYGNQDYWFKGYTLRARAVRRSAI